MLEAMVWSVAAIEGLEHRNGAESPTGARIPGELPNPADLRPDEDGPRFAFWGNFDQRPVDWSERWPPPGPAPADLADLGALHPARHVRRPVGGHGTHSTSFSTWGAGPRARVRMRTSIPPASRPASTCTRRSSFPAPRRSGCFSTPTRPWPTAACFELDRPRVVTGPALDRQRRGPGGVPAHLISPCPSTGPGLPHQGSWPTYLGGICTSMQVGTGKRAALRQGCVGGVGTHMRGCGIPSCFRSQLFLTYLLVRQLVVVRHLACRTEGAPPNPGSTGGRGTSCGVRGADSASGG